MTSVRTFYLGLTLTGALLAQSASAASITFNVLDDPGEGFNDPRWGTLRLAPFLRAAEIAGDLLLPSHVDETIAIDLHTTQLPTFTDAEGRQISVNAYGRPRNFVRFFEPASPGLRPDTWYPVALASHLVEYDWNGSVESEMVLGINDRFNQVDPLNRPELFDGAALKPEVFDDLVGLGLHEIAHGIGLFSLFPSVTGAEAAEGWATEVQYTGLDLTLVLDPLPSIFDRLVVDADGVPIPDLAFAERLEAPAGGVFWSGPGALAANEGVPPRLYTEPGFYEDHLDFELFPDAIMRARTRLSAGDLFTAAYMPIDIAMLGDVGWSIRADEPRAVIPVPAALPLLLSGLAALGAVALRRARLGLPVPKR